MWRTGPARKGSRLAGSGGSGQRAGVREADQGQAPPGRAQRSWEGTGRLPGSGPTGIPRRINPAFQLRSGTAGARRGIPRSRGAVPGAAGGMDRQEPARRLLDGEAWVKRRDRDGGSWLTDMLGWGAKGSRRARPDVHPPRSFSRGGTPEWWAAWIDRNLPGGSWMARPGRSGGTCAAGPGWPSTPSTRGLAPTLCRCRSRSPFRHPTSEVPSGPVVGIGRGIPPSLPSRCRPCR